MGKKRNAKAEEGSGTNKKQKTHEKKSDRKEESPEWFSTPPNAAPALPALSKHERKKQKRAEGHKKRLNAAADPPESNDTPVSTEQQKSGPVVSGTTKLEPMVTDTVQQAIPSVSNSEQSPTLPMPNLTSDTLTKTDLKPCVSEPPQSIGLPTPNGYTTVDSLIKTDSISGVYTTAAVVIDIPPWSTTSSSDFKCTITITDPSSWDSSRKFKINCFTKQYSEWLPQAQKGDIIILKDLKLKRYAGSNQGQGYADKLQWACYSNGEMIRPTFAPSSTVFNAREFSPFYRCGEEEVEYCRQLAAWYARVQVPVKEDPKGTVFDVGAQQQKRSHQLLGEVGLDRFFDCTVEVLSKHDDNHRILYLYLTDYTRLAHQNYAHKAERINGADPQTVILLELWYPDPAFAEGQKLEKGDVVTLKNVRLKLDRDGINVKMKTSDAKIHKVSETDSTPVVRQFFERRRAFRNDEVIPELEYRAISEFLDNVYAHCVAEVLSIRTDADPPQFWITDYSFRSELCQTRQTADWAEGLLGRALRITLEGRQIETVKSLEQGAFISIQDLRLKRQVGVFGGHIGGNRDLIRVVKEDTSATIAEAIGLLKRRKSSYPTTFCRDLKPIAGCSHVRRMLAKVIAVSPRSMQDFITKCCTKCQDDIPPRRKACVVCNDLSHDFVKTRLTCGLLIEDERGDRVNVTLEEDCKLLKDFELKDPYEDERVLAQLRSVFDPLIGNIDRQKGPLNRNQYAIFEIATWELEGQTSHTVEDIQRP